MSCASSVASDSSWTVVGASDVNSEGDLKSPQELDDVDYLAQLLASDEDNDFEEEDSDDNAESELDRDNAIDVHVTSDEEVDLQESGDAQEEEEEDQKDHSNSSLVDSDDGSTLDSDDCSQEDPEEEFQEAQDGSTTSRDEVLSNEIVSEHGTPAQPQSLKEEQARLLNALFDSIVDIEEEQDASRSHSMEGFRSTYITGLDSNFSESEESDEESGDENSLERLERDWERQKNRKEREMLRGLKDYGVDHHHASNTKFQFKTWGAALATVAAVLLASPSPAPTSESVVRVHRNFPSQSSDVFIDSLRFPSKVFFSNEVEHNMVRVCQEGSTCTVPLNGMLLYGLENRWVAKAVHGSVSISPSNKFVFRCTNAFFGADPFFGKKKICLYGDNSTLVKIQDPYQKVASYRMNAVVNTTGTLRFGVGEQWVYKDVGPGKTRFRCSPSFFGSDPAFGVDKDCYFEANNRIIPYQKPQQIKGCDKVEQPDTKILVEKLQRRLGELEKIIKTQKNLVDSVRASQIFSCDPFDALLKSTGQKSKKKGTLYTKLGISKPDKMSSKELHHAVRLAPSNHCSKLKKTSEKKVCKKASELLATSINRHRYSMCLAAEKKDSVSNSPLLIETKPLQVWEPLEKTIQVRSKQNAFDDIHLSNLEAPASSIRVSASCTLGYELEHKEGFLDVWTQADKKKYSFALPLATGEFDGIDNVQRSEWLPITPEKKVHAAFRAPFKLDGASECAVQVDAVQM